MGLPDPLTPEALNGEYTVTFATLVSDYDPMFPLQIQAIERLERMLMDRPVLILNAVSSCPQTVNR